MFKTILKAIIPIIISALGGAMMVFSSYDDSPGGSLLGLMLIVIAGIMAIK
ncbi:hypothetical protein [[Muricauda] lutisoli]|uniref:Uncharacterized protein n=1 Tax=[Muricauda] lutisoli TaxID=2816035 RepID=A0ABS3EY10_9FLAO|nr:hypothetical protein [[Muricauda] lutisoli]MBO0331145.1 hypothetical protein [[Muricauda] lutisoli]